MKKNNKELQLIKQYKAAIENQKAKIYNRNDLQNPDYTGQTPSDNQINQRRYFQQKISIYNQKILKLKHSISILQNKQDHKQQCQIVRSLSKKQLSPKDLKIKQSHIQSMQKDLNETINEINQIKQVIFTLAKQRALLSQLYKSTESQIKKDETEYIKILIEERKLIQKRKHLQKTFTSLVNTSKRSQQEYRQSMNSILMKTHEVNKQSQSNIKKTEYNNFGMTKKSKKVNGIKKNKSVKGQQSEKKKAYQLLHKYGYFINSKEQFDILEQTILKQTNECEQQLQNIKSRMNSKYLKQLEFQKTQQKIQKPQQSQFQSIFRKNTAIQQQIDLLKPKILKISQKLGFQHQHQNTLLLQNEDLNKFLTKIEDKLITLTKKPDVSKIYPEIKQQHLDKLLSTIVHENSEKQRILNYNEFIQHIV